MVLQKCFSVEDIALINKVYLSIFLYYFSIYEILKASRFQFTYYLQGLDSALFQFTGYLQGLDSPLLQFTCYLHDSPFFRFTCYLQGSLQAPFLNLHVIYRIALNLTLTFTFFDLHVIYMIASLFDLRVIYRVPSELLFLPFLLK